MADGRPRMDPRALDDFERGMRLVDNAWIFLVAVCWLSWGWTTGEDANGNGGHDHIVQFAVVLLSPVVLFGIDKMRRACVGRARWAFLAVEVWGLAVAVLDPIAGYARGTILGAGLAFAGIPVYATAMMVFARELGSARGLRTRWRRARRWSLVWLAIMVAVWTSIVVRGTDKDITISGTLPIFALIISVGLILPGMIATTAVAANGTFHALKGRPGRSL